MVAHGIMDVVHRKPTGEPLRSLVETLWYCQGVIEHGSEIVLPTGKAQVIIGLDPSAGAAVLQGPSFTACSIKSSTQRRAIGVAFKPGGLWPFVDVPVSALTDHHVDLNDLWHGEGDRIVEELAAVSDPERAFRLLETRLVGRLGNNIVGDSLVACAESLLARGVTIDAVTSRLGVDRRTLAHRFRPRMGMGLKQYSRVRRFGRSVVRIRDGQAGPLASIAAELGYADQAHMTRDFKSFAGFTPGLVHGVSAASPNHLRPTDFATSSSTEMTKSSRQDPDSSGRMTP